MTAFGTKRKPMVGAGKAGPGADGLVGLAALRCLSLSGLPVQVAAGDAFQNPLRWLDLGSGRLEDRVLVRAGPSGERRAEIFVAGVFGEDLQALPFSQPTGKGTVLRGSSGTRAPTAHGRALPAAYSPMRSLRASIAAATWAT